MLRCWVVYKCGVMVTNVTNSLFFSVMRDVYSMLGEDSFGQTKKMFEMMDKDGDNKITEAEFIRASMEDPELTRMLSCRN